ncbi:MULTISPECIES: TRAP transporter large permease [unclassified Sedimentibacter]|uniref:TRAP transporter large permease n=1 Tax=unclassified Sedimentibacter TaxID=2649220 RepID=UPI0027DF6DBD|nr:TRAP transporter large permease [Sedimentibacter sp. MB35-C1]WMJ77195.1 TRAP transporter large permease [Sedimentibacter sp. MB35-C1]
METALLFVLLLVFATLTLPIGVSLGLATLIIMKEFTNIPLSMISQNVFAGLDSFALLAIPFFMLAGNLMALGGIAKRIVNLADYAFGKITGGLAIVNVVSCMFFAAISGSGPATVSAIGSIMIPEMENRGYEKSFSTGLTAVAGTIGVVIPPSIPFVVYGVVAGASIGDIFIAGIIPGLLIGIALVAVAYFISKKRGYRGKEREKSDLSFFKVFKDSFWALMAPVIILGGIYGGVFTPTEASVVAIVYSLFAGIFIYKELTWKIWIDSLKATADLNGMTGLAIGFSMAFASYLSVEQIPVTIGAFLGSAISSDIVMKLLILVILLVVGCFVDNISSCLILTPVFLPLVKSMGVDPIHFGIFMTVALAIGFVTPPYGANLFVASAVANMRYENIAKAAIPFLISMVVCLLLITFIPDISMFLVYLMRG